MSRRNLPEAEAFRLLQRQSQDRRMPMAKLAESIVQADELLESPSPGAGPRPRRPPRPAEKPPPDGKLFDGAPVDRYSQD